jgi:hypothetical protein
LDQTVKGIIIQIKSDKKKIIKVINLKIKSCFLKLEVIDFFSNFTPSIIG